MFHLIIYLFQEKKLKVKNSFGQFQQKDVVSIVDGQKIVAVNEGVITFTVESYSCDNYYNEYYDDTPSYGINEVVTATYNITITVNKAVENDIHESKPDNNKKNDKPLTIKGEVLPYCKGIAKMSLTHSNLKRVVYGKSVMGKPLEAYEIYNKSKNNKYKKTLFIDFAIHGFEDEYYRDGKVLVKESKPVVQLQEGLGYSPTTKLRLSTEKIRGLGWKPYYDKYTMFDRLIKSFKE